jgi:hypothetical protein
MSLGTFSFPMPRESSVQAGNVSLISCHVARNLVQLPALTIWTGQSPQPPSSKLARPSPVRGAFLLDACVKAETRISGNCLEQEREIRASEV